MAYPLSILIAEDNLINQKLAQRVLSKLGYNPVMVNNGKETVAVFFEHIFDIILTNIQIPKMDAFQATQVISATIKVQQQIIIMNANAFKLD